MQAVELQPLNAITLNMPCAHFDHFLSAEAAARGLEEAPGFSGGSMPSNRSVDQQGKLYIVCPAERTMNRIANHDLSCKHIAAAQENAEWAMTTICLNLYRFDHTCCFSTCDLGHCFTRNQSLHPKARYWQRSIEHQAHWIDL